GLRSSSISWPVSSLYESDTNNGNFIGFTMPLVDTSLFNEAHRYYDPEDRLKILGGSFSWLYLLTTAFNISFVVSAIHEKGHRIGDMSASNILVARTAAVSIIDCDSFQIEDKDNKKIYYTKVATGDFLPPELMGRNFRDDNIDRYYSDLFALGVIIFKLLMNGYHPYQARGKKVSEFPTTEQKIKNGFFPYDNNFPDIRPPKNALPYGIISPPLRDLFSRCFVSGHKNKNLRPSALEWAETLRDELSKIRQCKSNSNHWYSAHLDFCPWCRIKNSGADNKDLFPPDKVTAKGVVSKRPFGNEYKPAKIFTPILKVTEKRIDLRPLNMGPVIFKLDIENIGDGILTGKISSDRDWILIKEPDFTAAKNASAEISIDKSLLPTGYGGVKFAGNIVILTNGGNLKVPVTIAAAKAPLAELSIDKIMLKQVKKGEILKINAILTNKGDELLTGSVKTNKDWLSVSPESFSTFSNHTFEIIIDTKKADNNIFILGKVEISTNGGSFSVPVGLTFLE
ncbi:MAG: protein kinase, partial [Methanomicrobium sp.]|nr:protein kinase [Methanomicrobium sp.]